MLQVFSDLRIEPLLYDVVQYWGVSIKYVSEALCEELEFIVEYVLVLLLVI